MKTLLQGLAVPATVVELDTLADGDAVQAGVAEVSGRRTVPQVFIGGKHVGGCDGESVGVGVPPCPIFLGTQPHHALTHNTQRTHTHT